MSCDGVDLIYLAQNEIQGGGVLQNRRMEKPVPRGHFVKFDNGTIFIINHIQSI
jgi:hypothetical protein